MSIITAIATATPPFKHNQEDILTFMQNVYKNTYQIDEKEQRKIKILYKKTGINTRYSCLSDYSKPQNDWEFYPKNAQLIPFPDVALRMDFFDKYALPLALKAIKQLPDFKEDNLNIQQENQQENIPKTTPKITHLLTVSCTGLAAPGLDIALVSALNLPTNTVRSSVNFMGCYAGFHALKQADYICKADNTARVLVVCVELCTLHFQKNYDTDNLTANALFADGACACIVVPTPAVVPTNTPINATQGLKIENFYSEILVNGEKDMAWRITSSGFLMTLSGYISQLIGKDMKILFEKVLLNANLAQNDIKHWAIHPGGKKILEAVESSLQLPQNALEISHNVLKNYGNMSSVTIFFVLKEMLEEKNKRENQQKNQQKEHIFATGFGPGLTMETAIFS